MQLQAAEKKIKQKKITKEGISLKTFEYKSEEICLLLLANLFLKLNPTLRFQGCHRCGST